MGSGKVLTAWVLKLRNTQYMTKIKQSDKATKAFAKKAQEDFKAMGVGLGIATAAAVLFIREAGRIDSIVSAFRASTAAFGVSGKTLVSAIEKSSAGMIDQVKIMEHANTAMALLGDKAVKHLPKMAEIAKAAAKLSGESVDKMFSDLIVATGRQSIQVLDNLKISSATASKLMDEYAVSIGTTRNKLDAAGKSQAFFYAAMKAGQQLIDKAGGATLSLGEKLQILEAQSKNLATSFIQKVTPALSDLATAFISTDSEGGIFSELLDGMAKKISLIVNDITLFADAIKILVLEWKMAFQGVKAQTDEVVAATKVLQEQYDATWKHMQSVTQKSIDIMSGKIQTHVETTAIANKTIEESHAALEVAKTKKTKEENELRAAMAHEMTALSGELWRRTLSLIDDAQREAMERETARLNHRAALLKKFITTHVADEDERASKILAIERWEAIKRWQIKKKEVQAFKNTATMQAIVSTAQAAIAAASSVASIPYVGTVLAIAAAGMMAALGGGLIAQIQSTPMPPPPMFAQGAMNIPQDTFAQLHRGEMVIPESFADSIRSTISDQGGAQVIQLNVDGRVLAQVVDDQRNRRASKMGATNYNYGGVYK